MILKPKVRCLRILIFLAAFFAGVVAVAAAEASEFNTWFDGAAIYKLNDRWRYDGDYGIRGLVTDEDVTQIYLRPSVRFRDQSWYTLHGGAALFYSFLRGAEDLPEFRPWVGARFTWPRPGGFAFSHYFRLEYRAFHLRADSRWNTVFRGRYRLQVTTPRFDIGSSDDFYGLAFIEVFETTDTIDFNPVEDAIDGTFGDRIRLDAGFGKWLNDDLRLELHYLFHRVRLAGEKGFIDSDDHVLRLRIFYIGN